MIDGLATQRTVPLSDHIRDQILKDVWLRENTPNFDPRWLFLDAPPSQELADFLELHKIVSVLYGK